LTARSSEGQDRWVPRAACNGIELEYETHGDPAHEPMLLVMGLGSQLVHWSDDFVHGLADRGFHVVRFDNRDVGRSTWIDTPELDIMTTLMSAFAGQPVEAPYLLSDLAADAVGLLDHLGIGSAHVVGASMGGMIAQTMAIEHRDRVRTLTSIMSTTGEREYGQPLPEVIPEIMRPPTADREEAIEAAVRTRRVISSPEHFDEDSRRAMEEIAHDRGRNPIGTARQLIGIAASGSRAEQLQHLDVPALVVHGDADPLVTVSGGRRTAELIPGARYVEVEGMGHDIPSVFVSRILDEIADLAARAA
jgi:pimeloyl-ACP methyl ester carboxylesterase